MQNTFFDRDSYENDIELDVNQDVLERIYKDGIKPTDILPIEFYFLTDTEEKATNFSSHLKKTFPEYDGIEIRDYDENFEISGFTNSKLMSLQSINEWNKAMWDLGHEFDCKLDGWQVGI